MTQLVRAIGEIDMALILKRYMGKYLLNRVYKKICQTGKNRGHRGQI